MLGPNTLPQKKWVNIHELLEHIHQLISADSPNEVKIVRDYDPSVPMIFADPDQMIQAILNLVCNAVSSLYFAQR